MRIRHNETSIAAATVDVARVIVHQRHRGHKAASGSHCNYGKRHPSDTATQSEALLVTDALGFFFYIL